MGIALAPASYTTGTDEGTVTVEWAYSGWASAEVEGREAVESRVGSLGELASLLARAGVPEPEAAAVARDAWRRRPPDAGLEQARLREAAWRGTGLPAGLVLVLLAYVLVAALLVEYVGRSGPAVVVAGAGLVFLATAFLYARRR